MPDKETTFSEMGFLSQRVKRTVATFHNENQPWVALYYKLNRLGHEQYDCLPKRSKDARGLLISNNFYRVLISYQSAFLLIEVGNDIDAKGMMRNAMDSLFTLAALVKDKAFTEKYVRADEDGRLNRLNSMINGCKAQIGRTEGWYLTKEFIVEPSQMVELETEKKALEAESKQNPKWVASRDIKISEVADKAGMGLAYKVGYKHLCLYAHPSPSGTSDFLQTDNAGNITGFKIGQMDHSAKGNMGVAICTLLDALKATAEYLNQDRTTELDEFYAELEALRNEKC